MPDAAFETIPAWPFAEARRLRERLLASGKKEALFETGYGPSGLPHIGTFGEVARTSWVRRAFSLLTGMPSRLVAFSDDMDGLRKVPDNVPNGDVLRQHLGKRLTEVPDPFGTHPSFGAHNNARLRAFLDAFGFEYEFASSTDYYTSGRFDDALLRMAALHAEVREVILPTLGAERRATYSPFLPIHPETRVVMQVPMEEVRADGTLVWTDEDGKRWETPVTGGHCKAQWKADWALRWYALGVDYEMSGKDLIDSVKLSSAICRVLGAEPPVTLTYEMFNDEHGGKISKSKGNGLTIEQWLDYGPPESLAQFMFPSPGSAKRLHKGVIPRAVDDWLANAEKLRGNPDDAANPAWYIHAEGAPPAPPPVSFATLLNLAGIANTDDPARLWAYLRKYYPEATPESEPLLDRLVHHACAYWRDFIAPERRFRDPTPDEAEGLRRLAALLREREVEFLAMPPGPEREKALQDTVYDAGRFGPFLTKNKDGSDGVGRAWFQALYEVLLGKSEGPRFGGTVAVMGIEEAVRLVEGALARA
ncbi:lysine--tRNA ligase [Sabulicella glaciei]|uniref:Lysine--tRNA ligase n=1 Tax=Sabulicella glaciei TaxID=2984948 RepID=A0ABT3P0K3_9PROT|nr:lysine--tRNA ligase [Roseococcus sp. MDT2-1-1]MCW8087945.1 lysine--tRNA ligase [Roseococcus sp. MDT2-1-1]